MDYETWREGFTTGDATIQLHDVLQEIASRLRTSWRSFRHCLLELPYVSFRHYSLPAL